MITFSIAQHCSHIDCGTVLVPLINIVILIAMSHMMAFAHPQPTDANARMTDGGKAQADSIYRYQYADVLLGPMEFEWNPAQESWLQFHIRMCGSVCNGTEHMTISETHYPFCSSACLPCDCTTTCSIYGTCCPQFDPKTPLLDKDRRQYIYSESYKPVTFTGRLDDYDFIDTNNYLEFVEENPALEIDVSFKDRFKCLQTSWYIEAVVEYHYAIADCPREEFPGTTNNDITRKFCEISILSEEVTLDLATPILDIRNGIVFKNRHCLLCNTPDLNPSQFLNVSDESDFTTHNENNVSASVSVGVTSSFRKWKVGISCAHYQNFYQIETKDAFFRAILKEINQNIRSRCAVIFEPPTSSFIPRQCNIQNSDESPFGDSVYPTRECMFKAGVYQEIEDLCQSKTSEAYRFYQRQNVFCYMCVNDFPNCEDEARGSTGAYVTSYLSFLFGESLAVKLADAPNQHGNGEHFLCPGPLEWMNWEDRCLLPACAEGKKLTNSECESSVGLIGGLGYKINAILVPNRYIDEGLVDHILAKLETDFFSTTNTSGSVELTVGIFGGKWSSQPTTTNTNSNGQSKSSGNVIGFITMHGYLISERSVSRDEFERSFLRYRYEYSFPTDMGPVDISDDALGDFGGDDDDNDDDDVPRVNLTFSAAYVGDAMVAILQFPFKSAAHNVRADFLKPVPPTASDQIKLLRNRTQNDLVFKFVYEYHLESVDTNSEYWNNKKSELGDHPLWSLRDKFIDFTPALVCPHVSFDISQIHSVVDNDEIFIHFRYRNKVYAIDIASPKYSDNVAIIDRKIKICIDTFRREYQKVKDYSENSVVISIPDQIKRYFALICFLLSFVCLILTIITYLLFHELRTLPGLNILMLSVSLAFAQLILVVLVATLGFIPRWLCVMLAMAIHYSWLAAFQWMAVCCFHMFTVFRSKDVRPSATSSSVRHTFEWYSFYAFGSSAVVVSLTIILSEILSGSKTTGYSPELCIFDDEWSHWVAITSFVIPVGLITLGNLVMFLITVKEIIEITSLQVQSRLKGRDGVVTYAKLSSLTGVFWLLTILAVKLDSIVLEFVTIPFVALQGVFIFFSFAFNAKTRKLYCQMMSSHEKKQDDYNGPAGVSITTASATTANITTTTATDTRRFSGSGSNEEAIAIDCHPSKIYIFKSSH